MEQSEILYADDELPCDEVGEERGRYDDGKEPSLLETTDLAAVFGVDGSLATTLYGYEFRPGQLEMAEVVKRAILEKRSALVEAPTGTGKSIAYLLPALLSERTIIVATANKSLQTQLFQKDIPFLSKVLDRSFDAVVVKGRPNFVCTLKWEKEVVEQQRLVLFDREDEQITYLREWLPHTDTGDIEELPFVLTSDLRSRVVSYPDDCIHRNCRHFENNCFVNKMRDKARQAQVIITNHHLLLNALALGEMGHMLLPEASIYIIDEAHHLETTATSVWEVEVSDYALDQLFSRSLFKEHVEEDRLQELRFHNSLAFAAVEHLSDDSVFRIESELEELKKLASRLKALQADMRRDNPYELAEEEGQPQRSESESEAAANYDLALEGLGSLSEKLRVVARDSQDDQFVRYAEKISGQRHVRLRLHAAPIDPAAELKNFLFAEEDRTVICTSATLTTDGTFAYFKSRCGVVDEPIERIASTVFDYPKQTLLYQPALPAYNWRAKDHFYDAVAAETARLLNVSRGRALCLFTSWGGLQQVHERLTDVIWPLQAQGQVPRTALLDWFRETPYSVLLATKSFWEGVDLPGDDLSLVVLDKMPFPTPSDPLHSARMETLDELDAGSSFSKYMLPLMTLALKQGFGRLIRRSGDRGVVAILDDRLTSKGYGRQVLRNLPPARFSRNFHDVHNFFQGALESKADFSLNVSAVEKDATFRWCWQLTRLQDGKADEGAGVLHNGSRLAAEIHAVLEGLRNLRGRIAKAGRRPHSFSVEIRCSLETEQMLAKGALPDTLGRKWVNECSIWRALDVIGLPVPAQ